MSRSRGRMHYAVPLVLSGLALAVVFGVLAFVVANMPDTGTTLALRIGKGIVLTFLVVLVLRYFVLIWLGYLQHLESRLTTIDEGFTPRVTVIVPAYNEGPVIQGAIRSLLDLDYTSYEILVIDEGSTDETKSG